MKQILLLILFVGIAAVVNLNAQCTKSAAMKTAALREDIIERKDAKTGEVNYLKKTVNPATGNINYTAVEYCTRSGQFVEVAPRYKTSCVRSTATGTKSYSKNTMLASTQFSGHTLAAQKAACLTASQKTQVAKATFVSLEKKEIKP